MDATLRQHLARVQENLEAAQGHPNTYGTVLAYLLDAQRYLELAIERVGELERRRQREGA